MNNYNPKFFRAEISHGIPVNLSKYENVSSVDGKYIKQIDGWEFQIVFREDLTDFLRDFYDNPTTGYVGCDKIYPNLRQKFIGVSRRDVAEFLANLETNQVH